MRWKAEGAALMSRRVWRNPWLLKCAIREGCLRHMFKQFFATYQVPETRVGLGLAFVNALCEDITAARYISKKCARSGTTFVVLLPLSPADLDDS